MSVMKVNAVEHNCIFNPTKQYKLTNEPRLFRMNDHEYRQNDVHNCASMFCAN